MKLFIIRLLLFAIAFLVTLLITGSDGVLTWVIALVVTYILDPLLIEVL